MSRISDENRMELPHVEIRNGRLGRSLFAKARFEPHQEIGIVLGQLIHDPDYGSDYCIALDQHTSLEPDPPFRFLNHSCEPNCELVIWEHEDSPETCLAVHALVRIAKGTELTIDYGWAADVAINCRCGAYKCRGWVVAEKELPLLTKQGKGATGCGDQ